MIRINLLQEKKAKRSGASPKGQRTLLIGFGVVLAYGAGVFFLVHQRLQDEIDDLHQKGDELQKKIAKLRDETKEFDTVQAQLKAANDQEAAIQRLNDAKAVPCWMLDELSSILTKDHKPTMTDEMAARVKNDANRELTLTWDPKHLWITSIDELQGVFTISGGAQTPSDATQFAQRLQASVYFQDIQPASTTQTTDGASKVVYYNFTITGKALY
jgi:Tfp pilus assembly protein PilN